MFAEACDLYANRYRGSFREEVLKGADTLVGGRLAYLLGYAFGEVLKKRNLKITRDELHAVAEAKIANASPQFFVEGFLRSGQDTTLDATPGSPSGL